MGFIFEVRNIIKNYGSITAVDNVSFGVKEGEFFSILGPSGCGKTTVLRIIGGFIEQNSGTVLINGTCMDGTAPNKRNTSMVFQNLALFPHMNVKENVVYGLRKRRVNESLIEEKLNNILTAVNLKGYEKRSINELSGGQQQRVALARSLIIEPGILLLDEPLASLDKKLRVLMRTELKEIQRRTGTTFLYVTHDQSEAITMSDNIAVMNNGRVIQIGQPDVVYNRPANTFVADFIGAGNFIPLERIETDSRLDILTAAWGGRILLEKNTTAGKTGDVEIKTGAISPVFFIRPEKIKINTCKKLAILDSGNGDLVNRYYGKITSVVFEGPDIRIKIFSEAIGHVTSEIKNLEPGIRFSENEPVEFCWEITEGLILNN